MVLQAGFISVICRITKPGARAASWPWDALEYVSILLQNPLQMFMVFHVWTQNRDVLCALSAVYLSLEIHVSYQLLTRIPDFYELCVS